jgi:hypothetical protein
MPLNIICQASQVDQLIIVSELSRSHWPQKLRHLKRVRLQNSADLIRRITVSGHRHCPDRRRRQHRGVMWHIEVQTLMEGTGLRFHHTFYSGRRESCTHCCRFHTCVSPAYTRWRRWRHQVHASVCEITCRVTIHGP